MDRIATDPTPPPQPTLFELAVPEFKNPPPRRHSPRKRHRGRTGVKPAGALVLEFHEAFGLPIGSEPTLEVPLSLLKLRHELLIEELRELVAAIDADDVVTVADALGDMVYVLYGTAVTFGINLDAVVAAIHLSNMSKIGPEGRPIMRPDGKVLKGPGYSPPAIAEALKAPRT